MHILINGWFAGQQTTGSGQYLAWLLPYLAQQNSATRITLLLPKGAEPVFTFPLPANLSIATRSLPALSKNLNKLWWEQSIVPTASRRLQADLLWVPYWAAPFWQPIPTVVTIHDVIQLILPAYRGGLLNQLYTKLVSVTAKRCQSIITVSHASKRDIVNYLHVPEAQVRVVQHGPNQDKAEGGMRNAEFSPLATRHSPFSIHPKYNLPDRYFLYLGGFDVRKNLQTTLAAYQRYLEIGGDPTVKLLIAGKLPVEDSTFMPDPRRMATALKLGAQVHFCGWVDDADKAALYAHATAFVFPTLYEGFGMMVLEAQAAGAPVISSAA